MSSSFEHTIKDSGEKSDRYLASNYFNNKIDDSFNILIYSLLQMYIEYNAE